MSVHAPNQLWAAKNIDGHNGPWFPNLGFRFATPSLTGLKHKPGNLREGCLVNARFDHLIGFTIWLARANDMTLKLSHAEAVEMRREMQRAHVAQCYE